MYSEGKWRLKEAGGKKCHLIYKDHTLFFHVLFLIKFFKIILKLNRLKKFKMFSCLKCTYMLVHVILFKSLEQIKTKTHLKIYTDIYINAKLCTTTSSVLMSPFHYRAFKRWATLPITQSISDLYI